MSPEKGKHKAAQAQPAAPQKQTHLELKNEEAEVSAKIDRLVSLTYDSNAQVRKNAAQALGEIDDPRSIFALLELSSDKEQEIKEIALSCLDRFGKAGEKEAIINLEKIFEARKEIQQMPEGLAAARSKLIPSLEKLFSNKDPALKERMMRSILEKYFPSSAFALARASQSGQQQVKQAATPPQPRELEIEHIADEEVPVQAHVQKPPSSLTPAEQGEAAADFPLPESLKLKTASPVSEIEAIMPETQKEFEEEDEAVKLHPSRIDFYKWAYALAVDPKMTAAKIRSEEKRLISQLKKDVQLAFRLAVMRARVNGIESLSGLKPGMKKITTFPLLVSEKREAAVLQDKKSAPMSRVALTDGKHTVPLYLEPARAASIAIGDHLSLHDSKVDFFVGTNELVFLLGKKGYITITK